MSKPDASSAAPAPVIACELSPASVRLQLVAVAAEHLPDAVRLEPAALHAWVTNASRIVLNR